MARILVVEDDPDIRSLVVAKLTTAGHDVRDEADGEAGLAVARRERPDVVLLDWMMPKRSGAEVCRLLRSELDPIIFMLTARSQLDDVRQGYDLGADDYIVKPFSPADLAERIDLALRARDTPAPDGGTPQPGT